MSNHFVFFAGQVKKYLASCQVFGVQRLCHVSLYVSGLAKKQYIETNIGLLKNWAGGGRGGGSGGNH